MSPEPGPPVGPEPGAAAEPAGAVWRFRGRTLDVSTRSLVMGVLNVTPDSFSDGGRFLDGDVAVRRGLEMAEEGADLIDVGGESTRPGARPVSPDEEAERVVPVVGALTARLDLPISIDTRSPEVARRALDAGASIVNDVSGAADPAMFDVAREADAGLVLMHMRGDPSTMVGLTDYDDVVLEVLEYLRGRVRAAVDAGVGEDRVAVDPGLGFAKTSAQSLLLMREVTAFSSLGRPVVVGPSRKSFIGTVLGTGVEDRVEGTAGAVAWMGSRGPHVVRVHDVRHMVRVLRVVDAIRLAGTRDAIGTEAPAWPEPGPGPEPAAGAGAASGARRR